MNSASSPDLGTIASNEHLHYPLILVVIVVNGATESPDILVRRDRARIIPKGRCRRVTVFYRPVMLSASSPDLGTIASNEHLHYPLILVVVVVNGATESP